MSAHDVARLTRRPRWVLASLVLLGRFPRKCRYHGRGIGWLRSDVLSWLTKDLRTTSCHAGPATAARARTSRTAPVATRISPGHAYSSTTVGHL